MIPVLDLSQRGVQNKWSAFTVLLPSKVGTFVQEQTLF